MQIYFIIVIFTLKKNMALNKLALLRYKIIDECLQNHYKQWTLEDLIEKVSTMLYEYEGIHSGVSKRTIQLDIQNMRSDKLGYNAPIIVIDRKYYQYEDKNFSIKNSKISVQDIDKLREIVKVLDQFKGFNYFEDIHEMVSKIEDKIARHEESDNYFIDFEKNEQLKGLEWLKPLLDAVKNSEVLAIEYRSFKARKSSIITVSPYLLKEYRNRWFLLVKNHKGKDVNLMALDRIMSVEKMPNIEFLKPENFVVAHFFDDVIGVTKTLGQEPIEIRLWVDRATAPYVLTKPLHTSQKIISRDHNGIEISIQVVHNFELEREILGFGNSIQVLSPKLLIKRIQKKLNAALTLYTTNEKTDITIE